MSRDERLAADLARRLLTLRRTRGVLWIGRDGLTLLGRIPTRPAQPWSLAGAMLDDEPASAADFAAWLGAEEVLRLDGGRVGAWEHALAELTRSNRLAELVEDGVRPLRSYRGRDLPALLAGYRERIDLFGRLLRATPAALRSLETGALDPAGEIVFAHCLGEWPFAPPLVSDSDGISAAESASIRRAALMAGLLRDAAFAVRVRCALAAPWRVYHERAPRFAAALDRLEEAVARMEAGLPVDLEPEASLIAKAATQPPANLFREHLAALVPGAPMVPGPLRQQANNATTLFGSFRNLIESARTTYLKPGAPAASQTALRSRLAFLLTLPDVPIAPPPFGALDRLDRCQTMLAALPPKRAAELWPLIERDIAAGDYSWEWEELARTKVPVEQIARAVRLNVLEALTRLKERPGRIARFLDAVETLGAESAEWLTGLFALEHRWIPLLVLTLVRRAHRDGVEERAAALIALGRQLRQGGPLADHARALIRAIDGWADPNSSPAPHGLDEAAAWLGLSADELRLHAHHRLLAGHDTPFPTGVMRAIEIPRREAAEIAYLTQRVEDDPDPFLVVRLRNLRDPDQCEGRWNEAREQARRRLSRGLGRLREESLQRVIDGVHRRTLRQLLGRDLPPGPLPAAAREGLALFTAPRIGPELLGSFLDDVLNGRPLADRQPNRLWLERAAAAGVNITRWQRGVRAAATLAGEEVTFATERDPAEVLRMGTYFGTCLTLDTGENAASTLINALDVNKQVIYGRRPDGRVVVRKLIGATADGRLIGYRTYGPDGAKAALDPILLDFAQACRLRPVDAGSPEVLHPGFWYDDGNESWRAEADELPTPPDEAIRQEWNFVEAVRTGDDARLIALLNLAPEAGYRGHPAGPSSGFRVETYSWRGAALLNLARRGKGPPRWPNDIEVDAIERLLAEEGRREWIDQPAFVHFSHERSNRLATLLARLPWSPGPLRRGLRAFAAWRKAGNDEGLHHALLAPPSLASSDAATAADALRTTLRMTCLGCVQENTWWRDAMERWVDVLHVIYLRDREPRPIVRLLEDDHTALDFLVSKLAQRLVIPGIARALRRRIERGRLRGAEFALALGTQGHRGDAGLLLEWLRAKPTSLPHAVAVVRTGDGRAAEEARRLWAPAVLSAKPAEVALRRELGSRRLAAALARVEDEGWQLATLGLPDHEPPGPHAAHWGRACELPAQLRRLERGDETAFAWLAEFPSWAGAPIRDTRIDRALYAHLAGTGKSALAFDALLELLDAERQHRLLFLPALPGLLATLDWERRERAAVLVAGMVGTNDADASWDDVLIWLRARPPERPWPQPAVTLSAAECGALFTALVDEDQGRRDAARSWLRQYDAAARLLLLDLAARRLSPEDYDRVLTEELPHVPWSRLDVATRERIVTWPGASYRWKAAVNGAV